MQRQLRATSLLVLIGLFLTAHLVEAQRGSADVDRPASPKSLDALFDSATIVVYGTVTATRVADDLIPRISGDPIPWIQTGYTVDVKEIFKPTTGIGAVATVEVVLPGGDRGANAVEHLPSDMTPPNVGDNFIFFLTKHPNPRFSKSFVPVAGGDGMFAVRNERVLTSGRSTLSRSLNDGSRDALLQTLRTLRGGGKLAG